MRLCYITKLILKNILFIIFYTLSSTSFGASIFLNNSGYISSITNIFADGEYYDVSFNGSFGERLFFNNESGAYLATVDIVRVVNRYSDGGHPGTNGMSFL